MSELLIGTNPEKPAVVGSIKLDATNEEKARQLPNPPGIAFCVRFQRLRKSTTAVL
jgi:hypothetical protein